MDLNHHLDQLLFFALSLPPTCRLQPSTPLHFPHPLNSRWPVLLLNLSFSSSLLPRLQPKVDEPPLPIPPRLVLPSTLSREPLSLRSPSSPKLIFLLFSLSPPSYSLSSTHCQHQPPFPSLSLWEASFGFASHSTDLSLPLYTARASSSSEEPWTTAKWCFQWGFLLPLLWLGGVLV